jgi:large subunit ribosomal protein L18
MLKTKRLHRHKKVRKKVLGLAERPRLVVFRSHQHIYAQIIDDSQQKTLASASDLAVKDGPKLQRATVVGEELAKKAVQAKIKQVVFDRSGFRYHGRVAALAEGARKGGLEF